MRTFLLAFVKELKPTHKEMKFSQSSHFEVREFEVVEQSEESAHAEGNAEWIHEIDESINNQTKDVNPGRTKKYHWALFLAAFFMGLAFTTLTDHPMGIFLGMGIGFLCFVDPVYQKIIRLLS